MSRRLLPILCLFALALLPAGTAWAGPVPDGEGEGKDDPSVQISFAIDDRSVDDLLVTGVTLRCQEGDDLEGYSLFSRTSRLRGDQSFSTRLSASGTADLRVTGVIKRNDDVANGVIEFSGRFDENGDFDANGRKCTSGKIRYRAERVPSG